MGSVPINPTDFTWSIDYLNHTLTITAISDKAKDIYSIDPITGVESVYNCKNCGIGKVLHRLRRAGFIVSEGEHKNIEFEPVYRNNIEVML